LLPEREAVDAAPASASRFESFPVPPRRVVAAMRILVVEGDQRLARSIETILQDCGMRVEIAPFGEDALEIARLYDHDVVVIGGHLPDLSAYDVLRRLRVARVPTSALLLFPDEPTKRQLEAFDDKAEVLLPPLDVSALAGRVRRAALEGNGHSGPVVAAGRLRIDLEHHRVTTDGGARIAFTASELAIVEVLALRRGRPVAKDELMNRLYGGDVESEPYRKIIDVFLHNIRRKIFEATGEEHIETLWRRGYALKDPAEIVRRTPRAAAERRPALAA
jgi:two-component system, cell cycle response regulator CtrA